MYLTLLIKSLACWQVQGSMMHLTLLKKSSARKKEENSGRHISLFKSWRLEGKECANLIRLEHIGWDWGKVSLFPSSSTTELRYSAIFRHENQTDNNKIKFQALGRCIGFALWSHEWRHLAVWSHEWRLFDEVTMIWQSNDDLTKWRTVSYTACNSHIEQAL